MVHFQDSKRENIEVRASFWPAEWFPQSGALLTWPHEETDWKPYMNEVEDCYLRMAFAIASEEPLIIVTPEQERLQKLLEEKMPRKILSNIRFCDCPTDDTWARDHALLTVITDSKPELLDFRFNGWGNKFEAAKDNAVNKHLMLRGLLRGVYKDCLDFVLEGGSIESDGRGTLLTTTDCLLSPARNPKYNMVEIEELLKERFHAARVLWLHHGHLEGDDTDGHIDTLARFCPDDTIAYVKCTDKTDSHYEELQQMEQELQALRTLEDNPYRLVALPMAEPQYYDGERLPATYANFFIINNKVLMPLYGPAEKDEEARKALLSAFPKHSVAGINCQVLLRQHGSLHCSTMQFPLGVVKFPETE